MAKAVFTPDLVDLNSEIFRMLEALVGAELYLFNGFLFSIVIFIKSSEIFITFHEKTSFKRLVNQDWRAFLNFEQLIILTELINMSNKLLGEETEVTKVELYLSEMYFVYRVL